MTHAHPHANADAGLDRLLDLLAAQRDLYTQLHGLSARQQDLIAAGETERLLAILSERQTLVQQLTAINADLAPLRSEMTALSEAAPADRRQALRSLVDEVQHLLEAIINQDETDRRSLESAKAEVSQELRRTTAAPRALRAYRSNAPQGVGVAARPATSRFTDRRG